MMTIDEVRAYLGDDHFATGMGISIDEITEHGAVCSLPLEKRHMNSQNKAQGGVLFTLGDFTFAVAAVAKRKGTVTLNATINYLLPGGGSRLVATAKEIHTGGRVCVYEVLITDDQNRTVALFTGTGFAKSQYVDKSLNKPE